MLSRSSALPPFDFAARFTGLRMGLVTIIALAAITGLIIAHGSLFYLLPLAAIPFVLFWPVETALGGFVFLIPFDAIALIGDGRTLTYWVGAGAAVILVSVGLLAGRLHCPPRSALWWLLFIAWSALSLLWAVDPAAGVPRLPTAAALILLYLVVTSFDVSEKEMRAVYVLALLGAMAASLFAVVGFYNGENYASTMRASLIVGTRESSPNTFAACLLLPISLAFAGVLYSKRRNGKIFASVALAIMLMALLLAMSRGALVAVAVLAFIYLRRVQRIRRVLVPITIGLVLLVFVPSNFFVRFQEAIPTGGAGRFSIWAVGLASLRHYWLLGAGVDNFPVAYNIYAGSAPVFKGFGLGPHNMYLGMSVEQGILGLILFSAALSSQFREAHHAPQQQADPPQLSLAAYEAACWAMLTVGLFADSLWDKEFWLCWILLAVAVRIHKRASLAARANGALMTAAG